MEINGLPAHILLVHAVVGLVPVTALLVIGDAVWPWARSRIGLLAPLAALATCVLVPMTTQAGEWLESRVPASDLVHKHAEMGDSLMPFALGMLLVTVALWAMRRWWAPAAAPDVSAGSPVARRGGSRGVVFALVSVLAVAVSLGAVVQVYRIGDSGARAAWQGRFSTTPLRGHER